MRQNYLASLLVVALLGVGVAVYFWRSPPMKDSRCGQPLTREALETSLRLGGEFLVRHQNARGTFDYEYDWRTHELSKEDNQVRQAGALWGLTLLPIPAEPAAAAALSAAILDGLGFYAEHSALTATGGRYPIYAGANGPDAEGSMGTAALVALSLIDFLRNLGPAAETVAAPARQALAEYLKFLVQSRDPKGLWFGHYAHGDGRAFGDASSYSDGESLLALVEAAKFLNHDELWPVIKDAALAGHRHNVEEALAANPDSDVTKGYYQWSSMALYELATSAHAGDAPYGDWLLVLSDWIVDVHQILERTRNTGYSFEGIIPAYGLAKARGDAGRAAKLECVIREGLGKLITWQVGNPSFVHRTDDGASDPSGQGGVQNGADDPGLRIDVTQHQMHATALALRFLLP